MNSVCILSLRFIRTRLNGYVFSLNYRRLWLTQKDRLAPEAPTPITFHLILHHACQELRLMPE